jgi:predicted nucleic acid-binding protein
MLLDTSGLLCLQSSGQPFHRASRLLYDSIRKKFTHSYILSEYVTLAHARNADRSIAIRYVFDILDNPQIEVVWVAEPLHRAAMDLLESRRDKKYSLCDAVSFVLMREYGLTDALTTDRHFEQEGFRRLLV